jgi:glycyl-tRNA synthetase
MAEPLKVEEWVVTIDKKKFGPKFKKDAKTVENAVELLSQELKEKLSLELKEKGKIEVDVADVENGKVELDNSLLSIEKKTRTEFIREYVPNVIEPSFGIGRILYALIEHNYWTREGDEARGVLSFPSLIAPNKVLVCPLSAKDEFRPIVSSISSKLRHMGVSNRVDDSGVSIGKRYGLASPMCMH